MPAPRSWSGAACALLLTGCVAAAEPEAPSPPSPPVAQAARPCEEAPARTADFILTGEAVQGGMLRGVAPRCATALMLDDVAVPMAADGGFLIAFDRDAGPSARLRAVREDAPPVERRLTVQPGNWRIERVDASPTGTVPSAQFLERRKPELARIRAARAIDAQSQGWRQSFRWPVTGRISGLFGAQRIYRGQPGSYHSGVDVAVPTGTPFVAPADGVVVLAAQTPFSLEGYLLLIDHGMGLGSAFLHCSSLAVKDGDVVRQGQVLGAVGATGRASGPHLHWGMTWRGARLDPRAMAGNMPVK
ncbi:MAG: peptidase [Sphingobium sp. 32-64-5]|nr:MAG: peptidase [Sphingobium sp. 32-64-5]